MMNKTALATFFAVMSFVANTASAQLITFDDLSDNGTGTAINYGYAGLNWDSFDVLNTTNFIASHLVNGFVNGTVSGNNVAYNDGANSATISSATGFNLIDAYFTGAWRNGLQIEVVAFSSATFYDPPPFTVDSTGPTHIVFNWDNITSVTFSSSGGTDAGYGPYSKQFVMDNLTISTTPIPAALWLVGSALAGLLGFVRRKHF